MERKIRELLQEIRKLIGDYPKLVRGNIPKIIEEETGKNPAFLFEKNLLTLRKLCDKFLYVAKTCQKITNSLYYLRKAKNQDNLINPKQNEFAQIRSCDLGGFGKLKKIWQQKHLTDQNFT